MSHFKNLAILALVLATPLSLARGSEERGHHGQDESSADGIPGDVNKASRIVEVSMREGVFVPGAATVAKGEQIHFQLRNRAVFSTTFFGRSLGGHFECSKGAYVNQIT